MQDRGAPGSPLAGALREQGWRPASRPAARKRATAWAALRLPSAKASVHRGGRRPTRLTRMAKTDAILLVIIPEGERGPHGLGGRALRHRHQPEDTVGEEEAFGQGGAPFCGFFVHPMQDGFRAAVQTIWVTSAPPASEPPSPFLLSTRAARMSVASGVELWIPVNWYQRGKRCTGGRRSAPGTCWTSRRRAGAPSPRGRGWWLPTWDRVPSSR